MAQRVVHRLEPVEIDHEHRTFQVMRQPRCQASGQKIMEAAAVGQPGQGVVESQVVHAGLRAQPLPLVSDGDDLSRPVPE